AFSPDSKAVLTGSNDGTARMWRMPVAAKGNVKRIKVWTTVLTGTEMDDHGELHVLDATTRPRRRKQLRDPRGPVDLPTDDLLWHRCQASEAKSAANGTPPPGT